MVVDDQSVIVMAGIIVENTCVTSGDALMSLNA
jgi:hypothetical protein